MVIDTNAQKGRAGLSLAIAYFGINGYTVSLPLNDTQWYDLIAEKDNIFYTVQCKFTSSKDKSISLLNKGGTKGTVYNSVLNHKKLDYLFCADNESHLYLIPVQDLIASKQTNSIKLRTEPNANHQGFETYKYLVQL